MKKVTVLCAENRDWFHKIGAWFIEKSEKTNYDHVAILLENNFKTYLIYEAMFPKSRKIRFCDWTERFKIIKTYEIELTDTQYEAFEMTAKALVGKPYSLWQCFIIGLSNLVGVAEHYLNSTVWNGNKALICSEFIARCVVASVGYEFSTQLDEVGLNEIEECLNKIGKVV